MQELLQSKGQIWAYMVLNVKVLPYNWYGGYLGHVAMTSWQTFVPQTHGGFIWYLASIRPVASDEKMFKNVDNK